MGPPAPSRPALPAILDLRRAVVMGEAGRTLRGQLRGTRGRLQRFPKCEFRDRPQTGWVRSNAGMEAALCVGVELLILPELAIRHTHHHLAIGSSAV